MLVKLNIIYNNVELNNTVEGYSNGYNIEVKGLHTNDKFKANYQINYYLVNENTYETYTNFGTISCASESISECKIVASNMKDKDGKFKVVATIEGKNGAMSLGKVQVEIGSIMLDTSIDIKSVEWAKGVYTNQGVVVTIKIKTVFF